MKRLITLLAVTLSTVTLTTCTLCAKEFHVSTMGRDESEGSISKPFKTISAAAQVARPGDVITVHEGVYRERVDPPRGGESKDKHIVYQAAPGEKVVIKGSEIIKGWQKVKDGVWTVTLPNSFFGYFNPYTDLIHGDYMFTNKNNQHTGQVYLNGKPLVEAATKKEFDDSVDRQLWFGEVTEDTTTLWGRFKGADPNEETAEINVRQSVFYPSKEQINYITVRGFTLTQAAANWAPPSAEQVGLIGTHWSKGWIIEENQISHSRCTGITLGKFGDEFDNTYAQDSQGWNKGVQQAVDYGWSKDTVGHHRVANNTISFCGQAGIVGSLGAVFSTIIGNEIHDIGMEQRFDGYEIAGIKFHAPIDVIISGNHIYRTHGYGGIWLDWMTQGARVTRNLLHDNHRQDLFVEVNHGPFMVDHNIFLSEVGLLESSGGGAYVHNLFAGKVVLRAEKLRITPFHKPHSTDILGRLKIIGDDERFHNNIFAGPKGLAVYDDWKPENLQSVGNVYLAGGKPSTRDRDALVVTNFNPDIKLQDTPEGWWLEMAVDPNWISGQKRAIVTSETLGKAKASGAPFEQRDSTPYRHNTDYSGKQRNADNPAPGPIEFVEEGTIRIKVWPGKKASGSDIHY